MDIRIRVFAYASATWFHGLKQALDRACVELGLQNHPFELVTQSNGGGQWQLVLFFSDRQVQVSAADIDELETLRDSGVSILPVVDTVDRFADKTPKVLHAFNAFALSKNGQLDFSGLVSQILDRLWHYRSSRRIFISYRRVESTKIARQIQKTLTNRGFEVFLDESTIPPGADFQRELLSWLNDSDLLLLLASPGALHSKWVVKEIEFANLSHIGVAAVCWPKVPVLPGSPPPDPPPELSALMNDQKLKLTAAEVGAGDIELDDAVMDKMLRWIDTVRIQAIHNRLLNLLPLLVDEASQQGLDLAPAGRLGDFRLSSPSSQNVAHIRVLPFRPSLPTLTDLHDELGRGRAAVHSAGCFYHENDINDPQKKSLEWALMPQRPAQEPGAARYVLMPYEGVLPNLRDLL